MNTPRRHFLRSLGLLLAAPFVAARVGAAARPALPRSVTKSFDDYAKVPQHSYQVQGLAIPVPSNRFIRHDMVRGVDWISYDGEWNGSLKMERGCANPAYIWAQLRKEDGEVVDWADGIYDWGRYCDEMIHPMSFSYDGEMITDVRKGQWVPRFAVNVMIQTPEERAALKHKLQMHMAAWIEQRKWTRAYDAARARRIAAL